MAMAWFVMPIGSTSAAAHAGSRKAGFRPMTIGEVRRRIVATHRRLRSLAAEEERRAAALESTQAQARLAREMMRELQAMLAERSS